jgi:hypothetical protein
MMTIWGTVEVKEMHATRNGYKYLGTMVIVGMRIPNNADS